MIKMTNAVKNVMNIKATILNNSFRYPQMFCWFLKLWYPNRIISNIGYMIVTSMFVAKRIWVVSLLYLFSRLYMNQIQIVPIISNKISLKHVFLKSYLKNSILFILIELSSTQIYMKGQPQGIAPMDSLRIMHYELWIIYPCHPFIKPLNNLQMNSDEIKTTATPQHGIIARINVRDLIQKLFNFKYHS